MPPRDIGFIGLGLMGRPLAQHLINAGHRLHVWARRAPTLTPFRDTATLHASPQTLAQASSIVFTMVADAPDVEAVLFAPQGLLAGAQPGQIFVDMSTIAPVAARHIAARLEAQHLEFLDAPVSGGEKGAQEANLTVMVGGKEEVFARVRPLFALFGKTVTYIGGAGAGQVAKACNQILTGVQVAAVAEALMLARQNGVAPERVREALLGGFAYSRTLEVHGQRMLAGDFRPGFKAWMHQKDLRIVMEEGHRLGLPLPTTAAATQMFNALVGAGLGEDDSIAIYKLLGTFAQGGQDNAP